MENQNDLLDNYPKSLETYNFEDQNVGQGYLHGRLGNHEHFLIMESKNDLLDDYPKSLETYNFEDQNVGQGYLHGRLGSLENFFLKIMNSKNDFDSRSELHQFDNFEPTENDIKTIFEPSRARDKFSSLNKAAIIKELPSSTKPLTNDHDTPRMNICNNTTKQPKEKGETKSDKNRTKIHNNKSNKIEWGSFIRYLSPDEYNNTFEVLWVFLKNPIQSGCALIDLDKQMDELHTKFDICFKELTKDIPVQLVMHVVRSEMFEKALFTSNVETKTIGHTLIFFKDERMPLVLPIYNKGYIHQKDVEDNTHDTENNKTDRNRRRNC